ncbi:hypothetical protein B0H14DRAFT_3439254 [Mycena olivaceomarginata]|nr:hypothetical protein B0H14DRAFT_3439254 [Mycena olivaceomarginata]
MPGTLDLNTDLAPLGSRAGSINIGIDDNRGPPAHNTLQPQPALQNPVLQHQPFAAPPSRDQLLTAPQPQHGTAQVPAAHQLPSGALQILKRSQNMSQTARYGGTITALAQVSNTPGAARAVTQQTVVVHPSFAFWVTDTGADTPTHFMAAIPWSSSWRMWRLELRQRPSHGHWRVNKTTARTSTRWLEEESAPPPVAHPKMAVALEGIWYSAAWRQTEAATNP